MLDAERHGRISMRALAWTLYAVSFEVGFFGAQIAPLMGPIRERTHASITQIGFLASAWVLAHALVQPVAGTLADRIGVSRVLTAALIITAGGAVGFSRAVSLFSLVATRVIVGVGTGAAFVAGLRAVGSAGDSRGMVVTRGIYGATVNIGYSAALLLVPLLYVAMGWSGGLLLQAAAPVILAVVAWPAGSSRFWSFGAPLVAPEGAGRTSTYRPFAMAIAHFAGNGMAVAVVIWGVEYLTRSYARPLIFGSIAVMMASLIGFGGRIISGLLLVKAGVLMSVLTSIGSTIVGLMALAIWRGLGPAIIFLVVVCFATNLSFAAVFSPRGSTGGRLGREFGFISLAGNLGSVALISLIGFVVDRTGSFDAAWLLSATMLVILGIAVLMVWTRGHAQTCGGHESTSEP